MTKLCIEKTLPKSTNFRKRAAKNTSEISCHLIYILRCKNMLYVRMLWSGFGEHWHCFSQNKCLERVKMVDKGKVAIWSFLVFQTHETCTDFIWNDLCIFLLQILRKNALKVVKLAVDYSTPVPRPHRRTKEAIIWCIQSYLVWCIKGVGKFPHKIKFSHI